MSCHWGQTGENEVDQNVKSIFLNESDLIFVNIWSYWWQVSIGFDKGLSLHRLKTLTMFYQSMNMTPDKKQLTPWGQNKMAAILLPFSNAFSWNKFCILVQI